MWSWARPSASACRCGTGVPTRPTWRCAPASSETCPDASSASPSTPRPARLPLGAPDPRAAHPPREGDVQHLHRTGPPCGGRRHVRGVPRCRGTAGHRAPGPRPDGAAGRRTGGRRLHRSSTGSSSTRSSSRPPGAPRRSCGPRPSGQSNCAWWTGTTWVSRAARPRPTTTSRPSSTPSAHRPSPPEQAGATRCPCPCCAAGPSSCTPSSPNTTPRRPCCATSAACPTPTSRSTAA